MKSVAGIKYCPSCKQNKANKFFGPSKNPRHVDGLRGYCFDCEKQKAKAKQLAQPEAARAACRKTRQKRKSGDLSDGRTRERLLTTSRTYTSWDAMKQRCFNPKNPRFRAYGGRGITICERWKSFENFLADMGERPDGTSLDRIDVNGNYEPMNCRWADAATQASNTQRSAK